MISTSNLESTFDVLVGHSYIEMHVWQGIGKESLDQTAFYCWLTNDYLMILIELEFQTKRYGSLKLRIYVQNVQMMQTNFNCYSWKI